MEDINITDEADNAKINAAKAEIGFNLERAKMNLSLRTAAERARGVRDQVLALIWPLVLFALVMYLINSKAGGNFLRIIGSTVASIKGPGGLEIAFASAVVGRKEEEMLQSYRDQAVAQYDTATAQNQVSETVERIIEQRIRPYLKQNNLSSSFRCTVHVRDILFENSIYQLIDYLPMSGKAKRKRGRAWSVRYGMIGRTWRLEENYFEGSIPKDVTQLMKEWGMTQKEAKQASGRQTVFCHLIRASNQNPLAIFYLDAEQENAFGDKQQMEALDTLVDEAIKAYALREALEKVWEQVRNSAPLIEIHGNRE